MNDGLSRVRETAAYRRIRGFFALVLALAGFVGLIGIGTDIHAWQQWLAGIDSWIPYALAYFLLLLGALALLAPDISAWRARRSTVRKVEGEDGDRAVKEEVEVSVPDPVRPPRPKESRKLSDVLQVQLDEGVRLRKDIPPIPGVRSLTRPETTLEDVEVWIRRTGRLLNGEPELKSEFNYAPRKALLEGLVPPHPFEPRYKKSLDQRIANLGGIISDLRNQDR
jgi:hypothetical protein